MAETEVPIGRPRAPFPGRPPAAAAAPTPAAPAAPLTTVQRLERLCDPGSLRVLRSEVRSPFTDRAGDGDGVAVGSGEIDGRPVVVYAEDPKALGGSLGAAHAMSICRAMDIAERAQVPVVGLVSSAGARLQEGLAALAGYGEIFHRIVKLSGVVPQISVVCGPSAGGGAYAPALTDLVIMTREAAMFLTGPGVVREVMAEDVDAAALGGPRVQSTNGVCHLVGEDEAQAVQLARRALSYLPSFAGGPLPQRPYTHEHADPGRHVPAEHRKVYDVRDVIGDVVDRGAMLELAPRWARNIVTAFARVEGSPVGVLANQPRHLGGVIDADAAQKAARFVRTCHLFGLPLVVLVDTPGFLPGTRQESAGVIRHGAKLVHAFAEADVPKITFVLRKSYGGAHIAMNSGALGADMTFAWPAAQLGVMGAPQAVQFVNKRELAAAEDPVAERSRLAAIYEEQQLDSRVAATGGWVDERIDPADTRDRVAWAMRLLAGRTRSTPRAHNIPL
ncbi:methylmalonyl-CoA carboxyltransferase [Paraconexibacter algicola]|uniref:Methylmalonyl-CoA carboxyltransferase n=2 Tax=Paraconexibacter algicola TaxID=2133960 RepID=A0A2T4UC28_9ACTN|nr:methylmalonyl-CoA carboxyltransferase [Paraconexibacter algicola]